jgi:hypothetical protein
MLWANGRAISEQKSLMVEAEKVSETLDICSEFTRKHSVTFIISLNVRVDVCETWSLTLTEQRLEGVPEQGAEGRDS